MGAIPSDTASLEEEALMAHKFEVPQPTEYGDEDFETSTSRVKRARAKLLEDPRAAEAHRKLGADIAAHLERKEATLAQVRRAVGLTQGQLAQTLRLGQGDISRIEQRTNVQLTTLARFIEATGGRLRISAIYGDDEVVLKIGEIGPEAPIETASKRPSSAAKAPAKKAPARQPSAAKKAPARRAALKG
jgi:transcriptional regulator with XRE-family HTH domain